MCESFGCLWQVTTCRSCYKVHCMAYCPVCKGWCDSAKHRPPPPTGRWVCRDCGTEHSVYGNGTCRRCIFWGNTLEWVEY